MKKPIDPNLNSRNSEAFLDLPKKEENSSVRDTEFQVVDKPDIAKTAVSPVHPITAGETEKNSEGEHHHHSSGSSHHHHSSHGKHSHSSHGKHHHSSGRSSHGSSSKSSRHHSSHHHSSKKKKLPVTAKIAIGIILAIILAILVAVGTFFAFRYLGKKDIMPVVSEDTPYQETIEYKGHTYKYNNNIVAFSFIGIDRRSFENVDESSFVGAADADMVAAVDTKTGKTKVIAIPRDTMVDIDVYSQESGVLIKTQKAQLCLAYSYGDGSTKSCESTTDAMSRILYNVPIQKYFALDLDGIAPLNDAIGGVTLTSLSSFPEYGFYKGKEVTLLGETAEAYVRTRSLTDIEASLDRTQRQAQYIREYSKQLLPSVIGDFSTVNKLYNTAKNYSRTNITLSNTTYLASFLLQKGVRDFETYSIKGTMKARDDVLMPGVVHAEFYPDEDSLMEVVLDVFYTQVK